MDSAKIIGPTQWVNSGDVVSQMTAAVGPNKLYTVVVYNTGASDVYVQVFDAAAPPNDGTWLTIGAPVALFRCGADAQGALDMGTGGRGMQKGTVVMISTTLGAPATPGLTKGGTVLIDVGFRKLTSAGEL